MDLDHASTVLDRVGNQIPEHLRDAASVGSHGGAGGTSPSEADVATRGSSGRTGGGDRGRSHGCEPDSLRLRVRAASAPCLGQIGQSQPRATQLQLEGTRPRSGSAPPRRLHAQPHRGDRAAQLVIGLGHQCEPAPKGEHLPPERQTEHAPDKRRDEAPRNCRTRCHVGSVSR
jgi:hypothetical protein